MARQLPPVDDDVFEALQRLAEPLVDDASSVLRRLLSLEPKPAASDVDATRPVVSQLGLEPREIGIRSSKSKKGHGRRPQRGHLLPEREYEMPILVSLAKRGGLAASSEVIEAVGELLQDRLTDDDRDVLKSGLVRWRNRAQFVRLKLVQAGQMKKDSPRGIWELTAAGAKRVEANGTGAL